MPNSIEQNTTNRVAEASDAMNPPMTREQLETAFEVIHVICIEARRLAGDAAQIVRERPDQHDDSRDVNESQAKVFHLMDEMDHLINMTRDCDPRSPEDYVAASRTALAVVGRGAVDRVDTSQLLDASDGVD